MDLALTTTSHANDINLSWSVRTLYGQALTSTVKRATKNKYSSARQIQPKNVLHQIIYQYAQKAQANALNQPFLKH